MQRYLLNGALLLYCILLGLQGNLTPGFFLCLYLLLAINALLFVLPSVCSGLFYGIAFVLSCLNLLPVWILPVLLFHLLVLFLSGSQVHKYLWFSLLSGSGLISFLLFLFTTNRAFSSALSYLFAYVLSALFAWLSVSYETLHSRYIHSQDEYTERHLLLMEKNQALADKQDSEIYAATLKERNRIAREIHDNVGHMLTRSILMTGAIRTINQADSLAIPLKQLEDSLNDAMTSIRESVHNLHDDSLNLEAQTRQLAEDFQFCPITLQYDMGYEPSGDIRYAFLAIVKEGLANIARHSNATHATIIMREHPGFFQLVIRDNGTLRQEPTDHSGIGLSNMRERVRQLHGSLHIKNEHGFHILITIPKADDTDYRRTLS